MKTLRIVGMVMFVLLLAFSGCKKEDEEVVVPVFLDKFEMVTMPNSVDQIKLGLALQPELAALSQKMKYNIQVYKITYKTLFKGDTILASGVIAAPIAMDKKEKFPMLSFQHGTIVEKSNAPSIEVTNPVTITGIVAYLASTGMVVVIPDYIGFGETANKFHPYMHKQYTVNAVLDMIRASKEFIATEKPCNINEKLFLLGYSQGASATIGALSAIENNSKNSDLEVTATSAGSGAYNLLDLKEWIMKQQRYEQPYLIAYLLESYSQYSNVDIDYSLVFDEKYASKIPGLFDGVKSELEINQAIGSEYVGELFNDNFENVELFKTEAVYSSLVDAFDDNKISGWSVQSPIRLYHGNSDTWITPGQTVKLKNECSGDVTVKLLDGKNHETAIIPTISESVIWFLGK